MPVRGDRTPHGFGILINAPARFLRHDPAR